MATGEPENLVLRELRKLRGEIADLRSDVNARFAAMESRFDRAEATGMKMWRTFIGNRALTERGVASLAEDYERLKTDVFDLQGRVRKLETARG